MGNPRQHFLLVKCHCTASVITLCNMFLLDSREYAQVQFTLKHSQFSGFQHSWYVLIEEVVMNIRNRSLVAATRSVRHGPATQSTQVFFNSGSSSVLFESCVQRHMVYSVICFQLLFHFSLSTAQMGNRRFGNSAGTWSGSSRFWAFSTSTPSGSTWASESWPWRRPRKTGWVSPRFSSSVRFIIQRRN